MELLYEASNRYPDITVLNLSSFCEQFPKIWSLDPLTYYAHVNLSDLFAFEQWYYSFIINNPDSYRTFLDIMRMIYNGQNVYILTDPRIEFSNILVDALSKIIFERYGAPSNIVNDIEDLDNVKDIEFTTAGLVLLDKELESYLNRFGYRYLPSDPE